MASANTSINANLRDHVSNTNIGIQKMMSSRSIPLWINPNNTNYYISNPYKAGDIVILLSDVNEIYYLLRHYYEAIATNMGVDASYFKEKNNPELTDEVLNTIIYGGYLSEDRYINPMTIVSKSEKGYGLYVSLKNRNYDIPGVSDAWFNLDMSETNESLQLQISRIISILTSSGYVDKLKGGPKVNGEEYVAKPDSTYIENRMDLHKIRYHFGENSFGGTDYVEDAYEKLNEIQKEIESRENTTSSIMRNPFIMDGEIIGKMMTIVQSTGQMFFYCVIDTTNVERGQNITIQFTPNNVSEIIVPFVLNTTHGIIEVDNPKTDPYVLTANYEHAWYADSFVKISNDMNMTNDIMIETNYGFEEANFNNNFTGFVDTSYIATYTPLGSESRSVNVAIHCSPVKEISRTNKSITFQLSSDYVWKYSGIAITLSGKYEVEK